MHQPRPRKPHGAWRAPGASIRPGCRGSRRERARATGSTQTPHPSPPCHPLLPHGEGGAGRPGTSPPRGGERSSRGSRSPSAALYPAGIPPEEQPAAPLRPAVPHRILVGTAPPASRRAQAAPAAGRGGRGPPGTKGRHSLMAAQGRAMLAPNEPAPPLAPASSATSARPSPGPSQPGGSPPQKRLPPWPWEGGSSHGSPRLEGGRYGRAAVGRKEKHRR